MNAQKEQNTKMFVWIMKRRPENYQEVLNWVYSLIPEKEENQPVGTSWLSLKSNLQNQYIKACFAL
jgi:hypothetical protein